MEDPPTAGSFFGGCGTNTTWPVCSKPLGDSVSGLCDMAGNVAEWTTTPWQQPAGPGLFAQVGSHWYSYSYADLMASGARMIGTMNQFSYMGFRCVRDIAPFARYYEAETDLLHQVGRQEGTAWSANTIADTAEHMAYGPYARDWPETTLTVTFRLMIDVVNNNPEQVVSIDVFDSTAGQVLADRGLLRNEFNQNFVYQDFTLTVDMTGRGGNAMEARVYWNDTSYVRLDYIFVAE